MASRLGRARLSGARREAVILLDTHALVWYFDGERQLGPSAKQSVDAALREQGALVSTISFWEVAMLASKGRLALRLPVEKWSRSVLRMRGIRPVPLEPEVAIAAGALEDGLHGDPADRIIVVTARALRCPVLTGDGKILAYGAEGLVEVIDARR